MVSQRFNPPSPPIGVIESLTSGFETVAGHLPLLLLPLLLDLVLWIGPRFSIRPAFEQVAEFMQQMAPLMESAGSDSQQANVELTKWLQTNAETAPDSYLPIFMIPSVLAGRDAKALPFQYVPPTIATLQGMIGAIGVAFLGGLVVWGAYVGLIANQVAEGAIRPFQVLRRLPGIVFQISALLVAALLAICLLIFFVWIFLAFLLVLGLDPASSNDFAAGIVLVILFLAIIPLTVFLGFTVQGMFLNNRNVLSAMWDSMRVVQWNLPATFGLFILISLINTAMRYIWELADPGSWLTLAAIGGNAFIITGLVTATFVFFKDRYRYWRELREEVLAEIERRRTQPDNHSR